MFSKSGHRRSLVIAHDKLLKYFEKNFNTLRGQAILPLINLLQTILKQDGWVKAELDSLSKYETQSALNKLAETAKKNTYNFTGNYTRLALLKIRKIQENVSEDKDPEDYRNLLTYVEDCIQATLSQLIEKPLSKYTYISGIINLPYSIYRQAVALGGTYFPFSQSEDPLRGKIRIPTSQENLPPYVYEMDKGNCYGLVRAWGKTIQEKGKFHYLQRRLAFSIEEQDNVQYVENIIKITQMNDGPQLFSNILEQTRLLNTKSIYEFRLDFKGVAGHATGIRKTLNGEIEFNDPNYGIFVFRNAEQFAGWFVYYVQKEYCSDAFKRYHGVFESITLISHEDLRCTVDHTELSIPLFEMSPEEKSIEHISDLISQYEKGLIIFCDLDSNNRPFEQDQYTKEESNNFLSVAQREARSENLLSQINLLSPIIEQELEKITTKNEKLNQLQDKYKKLKKDTELLNEIKKMNSLRENHGLDFFFFAKIQRLLNQIAYPDLIKTYIKKIETNPIFLACKQLEEAHNQRTITSDEFLSRILRITQAVQNKSELPKEARELIQSEVKLILEPIKKIKQAEIKIEQAKIKKHIDRMKLDSSNSHHFVTWCSKNNSDKMRPPEHIGYRMDIAEKALAGKYQSETDFLTAIRNARPSNISLFAKRLSRHKEVHRFYEATIDELRSFEVR